MAVAVLTGCTNGIGLNFLRQLLAVPEPRYGLVILAARSEARCKEALAALHDAIPEDGGTRVEALPCDLGSLASVAAFCESVRARVEAVDLLVLNAGLIAGRALARAQAKSSDGLGLSFAVNHLAHFALFRALLPQLRAAGRARVVLTSSALHWAGAPPRDGHDAESWRQVAAGEHVSYIQAYSNSKLCNVLMAQEVHRRFQVDGITANSLHPGGIRATGIWGYQTFLESLFFDWVLTPLARLVGAAQTLDEGGQALLTCALAEDGGGRYRNVDRWVEPAPRARDAQAAAALWEASESLLQERAPQLLAPASTTTKNTNPSLAASVGGA